MAGATAGVLAAPALLDPREINAAPADLSAAIRELTRGAVPRDGRVKVEAPQLAETGNAVPVAIAVESAMTADDRVIAIHILLEHNPEPDAGHFALGPACGRAEIATRLRMFVPQRIFGLAAMRDGTFWIGSAHVEVTQAACVEIEVR